MGKVRGGVIFGMAEERPRSSKARRHTFCSSTHRDLEQKETFRIHNQRALGHRHLRRGLGGEDLRSIPLVARSSRLDSVS